MSFDFEKLGGRPAAGQVLEVYLRDGKPIKAKWTGIQFSLSPSGRRETYPAYGNIWPSREALIETVHQELAAARARVEALSAEVKALTQ